MMMKNTSKKSLTYIQKLRKELNELRQRNDRLIDENELMAEERLRLLVIVEKFESLLVREVSCTKILFKKLNFF